MDLFGNLFERSSPTLALIDIHSGSVGGGYARYAPQGPTLEYAARVPVKPRAGEALTAAMLRALSELADMLVTKGAPMLLRAAGTGRANGLLVSLSAPWEDTRVRVERLDEKTPFTFTRSTLESIIAKTVETAPDRASLAESVVATVLNGYETNQPFGKRVTLADIFVLSSSAEKSTLEGVEESLRKAFHTHRAAYTAFPPAAYAVFRDLYPHEREYLIIDASGESTDIVCVSRGLLTSIVSVPVGVNHLARAAKKARPAASAAEKRPTGAVHIVRDDEDTADKATRASWVNGLVETFKAFSEERALPRTVFLFADADAQDYLRRALDDSALRSLWLSDEPLTIVPAAPAHFSSQIKLGPAAEGDARLMLLALFHGKRIDRFGA